MRKKGQTKRHLHSVTSTALTAIDLGLRSVVPALLFLLEQQRKVFVADLHTSRHHYLVRHLGDWRCGVLVTSAAGGRERALAAVRTLGEVWAAAGLATGVFYRFHGRHGRHGIDRGRGL